MQDVKTWMSRPPLTIAAHASALEAIERMQEGGCRHLPVVTELEELIGILSLDDLRAALPFDVQLSTGPSEGDRITAREYAVGEVMTYAPRTIEPDAPLASAVRRLVQHHVGCLPVVDAEGKLLGIFTESDALWALASLLEEPVQAQRRQNLRDVAHEIRWERARLGHLLGHEHKVEQALTAEAEEPMDRGDLALQRSQIELSAALADLAARRLDQLNRAIDRCTHGQLGVCTECGKEISIGRLRALPGTDRCLSCAEYGRRV